MSVTKIKSGTSHASSDNLTDYSVGQSAVKPKNSDGVQSLLAAGSSNVGSSNLTSKNVSTEVELVGILTPRNEEDDIEYVLSGRMSIGILSSKSKIKKLLEEQEEDENKENDSANKGPMNENLEKQMSKKDAAGASETKIEDKKFETQRRRRSTRRISLWEIPEVRDDTEEMASKKSDGSHGEKRTSQWEELMRKFSEANKKECKSVPLDIPQTFRSLKQFPTGSMYEGSWDVLGMSGFGTYTFANGVVYVGDFEDGTFHGDGELRYPEGAILRGTWKKGHMTEKTLLFADGLEYVEDEWGYCKQPDRRFTVEYDHGLQPSGRSFLTADQPTREIPPGYYDTGDGFFDPNTKIVYSADNITTIVRSAGELETKWIVENCRTNPDDAVGPIQEFYEKWSEPQTDPEPAPPPSAPTRLERRLTDFSDESFMNDDDFYEILRKSRTSCAASRSCCDDNLISKIKNFPH